MLITAILPVVRPRPRPWQRRERPVDLAGYINRIRTGRADRSRTGWSAAGGNRPAADRVDRWEAADAGGHSAASGERVPGEPAETVPPSSAS